MEIFKMLLPSIIHAMIFMGSGTCGENTSLFKDKNGTLHVSSENLDIPFAINNIGVLEAISALAKCMQAPCPPHHYRSGCKELMSKGNCIPCLPCHNHQYRSECMLMSEGICLNVTTCTANQFELQSPTSTTDRQCVALFSTTITATTTTTTSIASTSSPSLTTTTTRKTPTTITITAPQSITTYTSSTTSTIPCSTTTDTVLNCADPSSRAAITSNHICEVARVDNCCCNEFSLLTRVGGDVNVHSDETMLYFGTIREVSGKINGDGQSSNDRRPLQIVNFGKVTRVGGNVALQLNRITRVEFGSLSRVDGWLSFWVNDLTSIDFGSITRIGTHLYLHNNALTSIDFSAITYIGGWLTLYNNVITGIDFGSITYIGNSLQFHNNDLTSVDFDDITYIGGILRIHNNPSLTFIDCRNLGTCLCRSSYTGITNCPNRCTGTDWWHPNCF